MADLIITFKILEITDIREDEMTINEILAHIERRNPDIKIDGWEKKGD